MTTENPHNIKVDVETSYVEGQSEPDNERYVFSYTITIRNEGGEPAKLLTRHWIITDADNQVQEVRGDGVVGAGEECDDGNSTDGDGCNSSCLIDCSNSSTTDCNYPGSTKIPSSVFVDPDPPPGSTPEFGRISRGPFMTTARASVSDWISAESRASQLAAGHSLRPWVPQISPSIVHPFWYMRMISQ